MFNRVAKLRHGLIVGSQCKALAELSFLPQVGSNSDVYDSRSLLRDWAELLFDGPGQCEPVNVDGQTQAGLLINPRQQEADAALIKALQVANDNESVLVLHFLGHGSVAQPDPTQPVRHLLHAIDTVSSPTDDQPKDRGWDPYQTVARQIPDLDGLVGLVMLVDTCGTAAALNQVQDWANSTQKIPAGWLGASGTGDAYDACFTRELVQLAKHGIDRDQHYRNSLVAEFLVADIEQHLQQRCSDQEAHAGGDKHHAKALWIARNPVAERKANALGLEPVTESIILGATRNYIIDQQLTDIVPMLTSNRFVEILGEGGSGKSTILASLRQPPTIGVPAGVIQAVAFASASSTGPEIARTLNRQLAAFPGFVDAQHEFEHRDADRLTMLDSMQSLVTGPLSWFQTPVRLAVDAIDRLPDNRTHPVVRALQEAAADPGLSHVSFVVTSREPTKLPCDQSLTLRPVPDVVAREYLSARRVTKARHDEIVERSRGNWMLLELEAALSTGESTGDGVVASPLSAAFDRLGNDLLDFTEVLLAAEPGPTLPFVVLLGATGLHRSRANEIASDPDVSRLLERNRPGQDDETLGFIHQRVIEMLSKHHNPRHGAIADTLLGLMASDTESDVHES